ncbi:hypothetical protein GUJ93_ZPchr0001g32397 [Zizania palustris]|uniref:Uncharacterized protein n=1 Tax=Zizania palustris TaxID=103762 RepID=A0A8J5VL93_ZIZPA|nr:hypothetical protein GUJ93_ZPchr0001g32397 [Zizania palustris]
MMSWLELYRKVKSHQFAHPTMLRNCGEALIKQEFQAVMISSYDELPPLEISSPMAHCLHQTNQFAFICSEATVSSSSFCNCGYRYGRTAIGSVPGFKGCSNSLSLKTAQQAGLFSVIPYKVTSLGKAIHREKLTTNVQLKVVPLLLVRWWQNTITSQSWCDCGSSRCIATNLLLQRIDSCGGHGYGVAKLRWIDGWEHIRYVWLVGGQSLDRPEPVGSRVLPCGRKEEHLDVSQQRRFNEYKTLTLENDKLRHECSQYKESEKQLLLKEQSLRSQIAEARKKYDQLLQELKSLDVKTEK